MNKLLKKELNKYFKNIKRNLPCTNKDIKKLLSSLKESVATYIDDNNIDNLSKIEQHFGTAESVANEFTAGLDNAYIKSYKFKKRIAMIVVALFTAVSLAVVSLVIYIYINTNKNLPAYTVDEIESFKIEEVE